MRVGTVCYATSRGLGHLARDFINHGVVNSIFVVEHPGVPTNKDWYPHAPSTPLRNMDRGRLKEFCREQEAMLFFETPFNWELIPFCKSIGVRTYIITMYECTPITHQKPHRYICPSALDMEYFKTDSVLLPIPTEYEWKERTHALHYLHNGGYLGLRGREGTQLLVEAMRYVKSPLKLTIRCQENVRSEYIEYMARDKRIEYVPQTIPYDQLYATGDVCVQPQKFNGCSLPLQEACAAGLLMMTTDRFPMNTWLPTQPLIPPREFVPARIGGAYMEFQEAVIDPIVIACKMDEWYGRDIREFSRMGKQIAECYSWKTLLPLYLEVLSK